MNCTQIPEKQLPIFFKGLEDWALLRNEDAIGNLRKGGDCDLIVKDIKLCEQRLIESFGKPLRICRRSYVVSFYYPWGHFDVTDNYYWRGIRLLEAHPILSGARKSGDYIYIVSKVDEAITKLFGSLLWGGFVKQRYCDDILDVFAKQEGPFLERLHEMVGVTAAETIFRRLKLCDWDGMVAGVPYIRKRVVFSAMRKQPFQVVFGQINFVYREFMIRFESLVPILVLRLPSRGDVVSAKENLDQLLESIDYHARVIDATEGRWPSTIETLKLTSFRARNGLVIILGLQGAPQKVSSFFRHCDMNVEYIHSDSGEDIFSKYFQFQRPEIVEV